MFKKIALFAFVVIAVINAQAPDPNDPAVLCGPGCITCPAAGNCSVCDPAFTLQTNGTCTLIVAADNATAPADNATNATAPADNATNATAPADNATNATAPADNATNATIPADNATNATIPADNATNATIPDNGTNGTAPVLVNLGNPNCSVANCSLCNDTNTTLCSACIPSHWFDAITNNGTCQQCVSGCLNCTDNITCSACDVSFTLVNGLCQSAAGVSNPTPTPVPTPAPVTSGTPATTTNPPNSACVTQYCSSCSTDGQTCSICQDGYYLSGAQCIACQSNCLTCSDASSCNSCMSGYYLGASSTQSSSGSVQANAQSACTQCPSGCSQCSSGTSCTSCNSGFRLITLPAGTTCSSQFSGKLLFSIGAIFLGLMSIFLH